MKKNIKKIIMLSTTSVATVMGIAPIITSNSVSSNNNQSSIKNNSTQKVVSNSQEIDNYLNQAGNYEEKTFVGDVNAATSVNNAHNAIDLSKLRENNPNKLKKAYRNLSNEYTSDLDKAKASFLKEPILSWTDNNGNYFDTQTEAEEYITKNGDFTESVGYYEVEDYANLDKNNEPIKRKINPLNSNDVTNLKKMAVENSFIENSGFTFERMSVKNDGQYEDKTYEGLGSKEIKALQDIITNNVAEIITKGVWLNPSLIPTTNDSQFITVYPEWLNGRAQNVWFVQESYNPHSNRYIGMPYEQLLEESRKFTDYDQFVKSWDVWGTQVGWWNNPYTIFRNARIKNLFGGQEYDIKLNESWAKQINKNYSVFFGENTQGWLGKGNRINYYFDLYLNQDYLLDLLNNNQTFKTNWDKHVTQITEKVRSYLKNSLKDLCSQNEIDSFIKDFDVLTKKILTTKLISEQQHVVAQTKSISQIDNAVTNLLRKKIISEVSNLNTQSSTFNDILYKKIVQQSQTQEKINDTSNIYLFKYNGNPLFKLDYDVFKELYGTDEFGSNPSKAIMNKIKADLSKDKNSALTKYSNGMKNISNSYVDDVDKGIMSNTIKKDAIDNYSTDKRINNISFASKTIQSSIFDVKYQKAFIDEERFKKYNISSSNLVKQLNIFENEELTYLNSQWGILESVYQYNKNLESLLSKKNTTDLEKRQLENNYLKDSNDIVVLFEKNKKLKNVRYAEYFNSGYKFNESLWDGSTPLVHSYEYKDRWIDVNKLNKAAKVYTVKDYSNNVIVSYPASGENGNALDRETAMNNAIQKLNLEASKDYVFYIEDDKSETLLKNKLTKLNVLKVYNSYTSKDIYYGFAKYDDMRNYLAEYLKLGIIPEINGDIGGSVTGQNKNATTATVASVTTAILILIIIEVVVVSIAILNKRKK